MLSSQILVLQEPDGTVHRVEVGPSPVMLGRGSDAEVAIMAPTVSRHHAVLRGHHGEVWVEDVGSKSGSRLNGEPLQSARRIRPGDTLELGGVRLKVRYGLDPTALAMPNHDRSPALPWPTVVPAVRTPADPVRFTIEGQSGATINNVGRDHVFVQQVQQRASFVKEIAATRTKARVLVWLGLALLVAGFGGFLLIWSRNAVGITQMSTGKRGQFDELFANFFGPQWFGLPAAAWAIAATAAGQVLIVVGIVLHIVATARRRRVDRHFPQISRANPTY